MKRLQSILKHTVIPVGAFVLCFIALDRKATRPVTGALPNSFAVIVLSGPRENPQARVVFAPDLPGTKADQNVYYMIPEGVDETVSREIRRGPDCNGDRGFARVKVKRLNPNLQRIEVQAYCNSDYQNVSTYEASATGIRPVSHKSYLGPTMMTLCFFASAGAMAVWGLVAFLRAL
jgi:hypothetical protein